jgi:predicted N-formylglutamate amidohydrolase
MAATGDRASMSHGFGGAVRFLTRTAATDPGALVGAWALAWSFGAPLVTSTVSRLLVDLNRDACDAYE